MGQYRKALPLYQEGLTIQKKVLGKLHLSYAATLNNLALLYQAMNQPRLVTSLVAETAAIYRQQVLKDMAILDETALQKYQWRFNKAESHYSMAYWTRDNSLAEVSYDQSLLDKGAGLLAYQQLEGLIQSSADTVVRRLANERARLRQQLRLLYNTNSTPDKIAPLEEQVRALQQHLVQRIPVYARAFAALQVQWPQVQKFLKPDEAAIEFVHFRYYHCNRWTDRTYYTALVLRPGWKTPRLVWLTEENELRQKLAPVGGERAEAYVKQLYDEQGRGGVVQAKAGEKPLRSLYSQLWQPLDSLLTGVRQVYYSPSGLLHRINLGAISTGPRQRLSDKYRLTLLASTRQVALPPPAAPAYANHALLLGDIPYDLDSLAYQVANQSFKGSRPNVGESSGTTAPNGISGSRRGGLGKFKSLDNTGPEVQSVADTLRKYGFSAEVPQGWQTSEEAVYYYTRPNAPKSPRYLHLATHGFFQGDSTVRVTDKSEANLRFQRADNSLMQSGVVLAGGNYAYLGGKPLNGQEDGILTAYDISLLDWRNIELVVLSACETGLGRAQDSEGVYGLQRALKMAGVRNIIMSLWQVDDAVAVPMMETFYGYLLRDPQRNIRQAFDRAIADLKRNTLNKPYLWAAFVLVE